MVRGRRLGNRRGNRLRVRLAHVTVMKTCQLRVLYARHGVDGDLDVVGPRPLQPRRSLMPVGWGRRGHRMVHGTDDLASRVEVRGCHAAVSHLRRIHDQVGWMLLMMVVLMLMLVRPRHGLRMVLGQAMGVFVPASLVNHPMLLPRMLQRMPVLLRMRILLLVGRVVLRTAATLVRCYVAPIVVIVHMRMTNLGVVARQPGVDAWDLPELTALAGR